MNRCRSKNQRDWLLTLFDNTNSAAQHRESLAFRLNT